MKKNQKMRIENERNKRKSTFTCDCNMKSCFIFPFTVFSATCVLTSITITQSINCESVVVTEIHPVFSPEYLRCRETAQRANELKRRVIGNRLILELSINFRRTWEQNSKVQFKKGESIKKRKKNVNLALNGNNETPAEKIKCFLFCASRRFFFFSQRKRGVSFQNLSGLINQVENVKWPPLRFSKLTFSTVSASQS